MDFTYKQLNDWRTFEDIRLTGAYNMVSPRVAEELGLSRDEHLFVIKNYAALKATYEAAEDLHYENQAQQYQNDNEYGNISYR